MAGCLICEGTLWEWFSFGAVPLANGFLPAEDFDRERFYDLRMGLCEQCGMVQLLKLVDRERLFHDHYPFFTSTSRVMNEHFKSLAHWIHARLDRVPSFIVEIGSNDGTLLRHCAAIGARTLGVEPSGNVAAAAIASGVPTLVRFFDARCAREIASQEGDADAVVATNVFSHISDLHSVLEGCRGLLKREGILVFEDPYLGDVLDNTCYDQFYDEHAFYFCASAVDHAVARHGLELIDVQPQPVHGGSMVYVCAKPGIHPVSSRVREQLARERARGLGAPETFTRFAARIEQSRDRLLEVLQAVRRGGQRVAGYAATSKSTTVLNYCQIGPALLDYVCDSTPMKQGLFTPGMHIPVVAPERFQADAPDYALLFGWNHAKEILTKEASFADAGGRWITYVPEVSVSEPRRVGLPVFKRHR
jgi:methylation protein EvaC